MKLRNLCIFDDRTAKLFNLSCSYVPELSGTKLWIFEFLDQGGIDLTVLYLEKLAKEILQDSHNGKSLGSLSTPGSIDLTGMTSPEVLCIVLKEHGIQLPAKAVNIEIFQIILRQLMEHGSQIAEAYLQGSQHAKVLKGFRL